jgi:hypothetical protein
MTTAAARAILDQIEALYPLDRQSFLDALWQTIGDDLGSNDLWNELLDRDQRFECDLGAFVLRWLRNSPEERASIIGQLAADQVRAVDQATRTTPENGGANARA